MTTKVRHMHSTKPELQVIRTPSGWKIDLPVTEEGVAAYFAERLNLDPTNTARLVKVQRSINCKEYKVINATYALRSSLMGEKRVRANFYWESSFENQRQKDRGAFLGGSYDSKSLEAKAFELLSQTPLNQ